MGPRTIKGRVNAKWNSSPEYRNKWDEIFGNKTTDVKEREPNNAESTQVSEEKADKGRELSEGLVEETKDKPIEGESI